MLTGNLVTLIDGRQVDSGSEPWRAECEARHVANLATQAARAEYLAAVRGKRPNGGRDLEELAAKIYKAERQAKG